MKKIYVKSKTPLFGLLGGIVCFLIGCWLYHCGLIINITASMPRGLYWRAEGPIHRGDLVVFCLSKNIQKFGIKRGYLMPGTQCELSEPLIKKVIAVPEDTVIFSKNFIIVNGKRLPYATLSQDSQHRSLTHYPFGKYQHINNYWVIGTNSPNSWDSRYFGPISQHQMLEKIVPFCSLFRFIY